MNSINCRSLDGRGMTSSERDGSLQFKRLIRWSNPTPFAHQFCMANGFEKQRETRGGNAGIQPACNAWSDID